MATTENGIYYPNDGKKAADVLADLKAMAESIDKNIQENKFDDKDVKKDISDIKKEQQTQNSDIENLQTNDTKQDELISKLKNAALNAETEEAKSLHVTDANKFGQLSVEGNQKQETREGYSLIDFSSIGNGNLEGVSYSVENDIITLNGNYNVNYPRPIDNIVNNIPKINSNFRFQIYPISGSCENTRIGIRFNYANGEQIDYIQDVVNSNNYVTKAMDLTELNTVSFFIAGRNDATFNNYKFKLMFIEGTEEKPYEQYGASPSPDYPSPVICLGSNTDGSFKGSTEIKMKNADETQEKSYTLPIQQEMLKGDYFVKEADGWKEVHNYNKKEFDGTEEIALTSNSNSFTCVINDMYIASNFNELLNFYSNHYIKSTWTERNVNNKENTIASFMTSLGFYKGKLNTTNQFKQQLSNWKNEGNPLVVYYPLSTSNKLPCTEEQIEILEELNNLDLYKPVTNIITTEDIALLKLKYALDVETYVDNKLNTINQQILEIVGGN